MLPSLASTNAAKKQQLQQEAEAYKAKIDDQVATIKADAKRIGTTTLVIGGILTGSYLLLKWLSADSKKKKKEKTPHASDAEANVPAVIQREEEEESWIVSSIKSYILAFVLAIAKEKLMEALANINQNNEAEKTDA